MLIVAHRGLHVGSDLDRPAPENSLAAVQAALDAGFDRIEVDVRATADGHLVLMHDPVLDRTTDVTGPLAGLRAYELGGVRLADGSPVPSLHEVLELCRGRAVLCLDVKEPEVGGDVVAAAGATGAQVEVWSSHAEVVARAADAARPAVWISHGVMPRGGPDDLADEARQLGAQALSFFPADLSPSVAETCRRSGVGVQSGTPNDRRTWAYLRRLGARAIVTDRPRECRDWIAASAEAVPAASCS